jgi:Flp pilus assembly protein TadD
MVVGRNSLALLLALALLPPVSSTAQNTGKTVRRHRVPVADDSVAPELLQAETSLDKKDYAGAEPLLKRVLAQDERSYRAWFDLGYMYSVTGRKEEAIDAYRKSVAVKPDVFESNLNLGLLLADAKSPEAEQFLRSATRLKPSSNPEAGAARAWLSLGHVLESAKPTEALDAFQQAARLQPRDAEPHLSAGQLLEKQNDLVGAEREYKQAQALVPNSADALAALANVYMKTKRLPEAETALRGYLSSNAQEGRVHIQLGRVLAAQGKHQEATEELQKGLELSPAEGPPETNAQRDLAFSYENLGKYDKAETLYRSLLQTNPNDPELHFGVGSTLMHQKRFAEAEPELLAAVKLKPDLADAYGDLAVTAAQNKNYVRVLQALAVRAKFLPESPGTYFLRATAYDNLKDFKHAAEYYRQFLGVSSGKNPEQEWQAQHRLIAIDPKAKK